MSNHRAIAAVTAALRSLIFTAASKDPDVVGTQVTARPPDRARQGAAGGNQLNIFLYRTSIDAAWRNEDLRSLRPGELGHPPLPLILSYLITAYGDNDDDLLAHRLLGVAMSTLHDTPVLARNQLRGVLPGSDLDVQIERVRITPHPIPMDEISRLWTTFQTGYRISASYDVAVVLIDSNRPTTAALPVLTRGADDAGPVVMGALGPVLEGAFAPGGRPASRPGEDLTFVGSGLGAAAQVRFSGGALVAPFTLAPASASDGAVVVTVPTAPPGPVPPGGRAQLPSGVLTGAVLVADGSGGFVASREVPVALSPIILGALPITKPLKPGTTTVDVECTPPVEAGQTVALLVGDSYFVGVPAPFGSPPLSKLSFNVDLTAFAPGSHVIRLRVDGQDSFPFVVPAPTAADPNPVPRFDPNQALVLQ